MTDGIAQCAAAMTYEERRLSTATQRLANVETDGFASHVRPGAALPLRPTGRPLDLVATGGTLRLGDRGGNGPVDVRAASLRPDRDGYLVDGHGRTLLGERGAVRLPPGTGAADVTVRSGGEIVVAGETVARVSLGHGAELRSGFVTGSDVNPIAEMMDVLDAQRQFETAQKTLSAIDGTRAKATTDVGKIQ